MAATVTPLGTPGTLATVTVTAGVPTAGTGTVSTLDNIFDATNGPVAVKAASTAPAAADKAIVVALSPNGVTRGAGASDANTVRVTMDSGQVGTLGVTTASASVPVAIASDQFPIAANMVSGCISTAMTATTSTALLAAPSAGLRNYITQITVSNSHATVGTDVNILDGATVIYVIPAAAVYGGAVVFVPNTTTPADDSDGHQCAERHDRLVHQGFGHWMEGRIMPILTTGAGKYPAAAGGGGGSQSIVTARTPMQYITCTWANAPTDATRLTIAYWQKFVTYGSGANYAFTTAVVSGKMFDHQMDASNNRYGIADDVGSTYSAFWDVNTIPNTTVWHHTCIKIDTNLSDPNKVLVYQDGVALSPGGAIGVAAGSNMQVTANGVASYIGEVVYNIGVSNGIPDAKFAYFYLIDGQALTPSAFITGTGSTTCHPITFASGAYGNNGFFLNGNGSSLADASGRGNNWSAPNGITYSSDVPT